MNSLNFQCSQKQHQSKFTIKFHFTHSPHIQSKHFLSINIFRIYSLHKYIYLLKFVKSIARNFLYFRFICIGINLFHQSYKSDQFIECDQVKLKGKLNNFHCIDTIYIIITTFLCAHIIWKAGEWNLREWSVCCWFVRVIPCFECHSYEILMNGLRHSNGKIHFSMKIDTGCVWSSKSKMIINDMI